MLYIYHVDIGRMFVFDMNFAMKKVRDLKKEIEKMCNIPYVNQVLVVSGGQIMDGKRVVGSYQAGTDNNPIWLVDNRMYSQSQPPKAYIPDGPDDRLKEYLESSMTLPPTYDTIVTRAQLSMRFHENGREEYKICETLVKDQHFQHQGWASLKCTLEDKGSALEKNKNRFLKAYDQFLSEREMAINQLQQFEDTRKLIGKIPIPKCLDHYAKKCSDRLMKQSSITTAERKISNFVSCVDKLDRSEYYSGSGPPTSHYQPMSDSGEMPKQQQDIGTVTGQVIQRSSPVSIRRQSGDRGSYASSEGGSQGSRYLPRNDSVSSTSGSVPLLKREVSPGFTSPEIQSPCATPKKLSHIHEEDEYSKKEKHLDIEAPPVVTRGIKFEISPTGSQISQASSHGSDHGLEIRSLSPSPCQKKTLSDWIRGNDSKDPIEMVKKELEEKFSKLTPELRTELKSKCTDAMKTLDNRSMKEFKGLDKRLAGLEQLMIQMKDLVRQQSDMAQGFIQNQQRARAERDVSVLPDLCSSHKKQLGVMIDNHQRICDIKRRITASKQELCTVLHARIRWIMHMEERLRDVDNDIIMTQGMLGRMFTYMKTLKQVHETPTLFAEAVVEGYRRKKFASKFKEWADSWAEENSSLYQKEVERRKEFNQHLSGHFLLRMFTGYGEEPPEFATKAPDPFDTELPAISAEDIELLRQEVPEISHILVVPDEVDISKIISSNTLRGTSSVGLNAALDHLSSSPQTTTDQATSTSFCITGSLQDDNNSDIVVLNANGEQGILTPSPEHKQKPTSASSNINEPSQSKLSSTEKSSQEKTCSIVEKTAEAVIISDKDIDLTQSVEVITSEATNTVTNHNFTLPFGRYYHDRNEDPRSISVQEPRSFEASPEDGDLNFHSLRSLSMDELRLNSAEFKTTQLCTSPDLDDYATADFYIDESIPSAMSASSPERTIAELHLQLEEKSTEITEKDEELKKLQEDNTNKQEKCEKLLNIISIVQGALEHIKGSEVVSLKEQLETLKKDTLQQKEQFHSDITLFNDKMSQFVAEFTQLNERKTQENQQLQQCVEELKKKSEEKEKELESQMEESVCVISEEWEEKLNSAKEDLTQEKLKHESTIQDLKNQLTAENDKLISMQKILEEREGALNNEKDQLERKVKEVEDDKLKLQNNLVAESENLKKVEMKVKETEELVLKSHEKITELENMKDNLEEQLQEKNNMLEQHKLQLDSEINDRLKVSEKLQVSEKTVADLQDSMSTLEISKTAIEEELCEKTKIFEERLAHSEEEFSQRLKLKEEKVNALQETIKEQNEKIEENASEFQRKLEKEVLEKENLNKQLEEMKQETECKVKEIIDKSKAELQETRSQLMLEHEVELEKVRSDLEIDVVEKEQELEKIKEKLESVLKDLEDIKSEKEKVQEDLRQQFQDESDKIIEILKKENEEKMLHTESELRKTLEQESRAKLDDVVKSKDEEIKNAVDNTREQVSKEYTFQIEDLKATHQKELEDQYLQNEEKVDNLKADLQKQFTMEREKERYQLSESNKEVVSAMEVEKEKELKEMKESLAFDFHKRITDLRADIDKKDQEIEELKEAVKTKEDPTLIPLEKHNAIIANIRSEVESDKNSSLKQLLEEREDYHKKEIETVKDKMEKEKSESLEQMKTSLTGERQVHFNEALNKAVAAKDKIIEELKERLVDTEHKLGTVNSEVSLLRTELNESGKNQDQYKVPMKEAEDTTDTSFLRKKYEEEIKALKQQLQQQQLLTSMTSSVMSQSVVPVSEAGSLQDRITQLQEELKTKEQEINKLKVKLQEKMGELSISPATQSLVKDKISITSCSKGDVVLLCLDDKYDHYVVFTVGTTLHFLHSDCLELLNLKPAPGETQRLWVLAEIVDKEYCQAKKAQNRFKVPVGTKFYRVRCKPWLPPNVTPTVAQQKQDSSSTSGKKLTKQKSMEQTETKANTSAKGTAGSVDKVAAISAAVTESVSTFPMTDTLPERQSSVESSTDHNDKSESVNLTVASKEEKGANVKTEQNG